MNRTYLQQRLKTNIIVQWLYMKYVCYYSKRFLANPEIWKKYQLNKLTTILSYAQQHCTYYKRIIRGKVDTSNSITLLKSLPLLDKNIIRHQEKNVYSDEITDNWKVWLNTGGSTGEPLHFPALYKGLPVEGVCQMMLYMKMGYQWGDIIVSFDGCRIKDEDRSRNIYWQMGNANFPFGKKNFSTLYLDNNSVKYYWEELKRTKPAFIRGYPSGIMEMCKLAMNTGIVMDLKLKGVYLTSESFTQDEKNFISSYFKCPVYGQYGHTESSIFAIQNPADEVYYCSPIYGYTEVVDQKGQHVNIGEQGEVVGQDLLNMVYHLSDIRQGILQSMVEKQNWVKLFLQSYWDVRLIVFITKGEKRFILLVLSLGDIFGLSIIYKLGNSISMKLVKWKCI